MASGSSAPVPLAILLDDTSSSFSSVRGWSHRKNNYHLMGSEWVKSSDSSASLTCNFEGTSITFYGRNQTNLSWQTNAILDGQRIQKETPSTTVSMSYDFMTFSGLQDGTHSITLQDFTTMATGEQAKIDYAYSIPGQTTPLQGKTLMMDDTDPAFIYTGSWSNIQNNLAYPQGANDYAVPHGSTAHQSQSVGDSFEVSFFGTSVGIYGLNLLGRNGSVELSVELDDRPAETVTMDRTHKDHVSFVRTNYPYYRITSLPASQHTLRMNITKTDGDLPFILDYVLYTAAFDSLASMPNSSSPSVPSPGSDTASDLPRKDEAGSKLDVKTVVGATVGAVLGLVACTALLLFLFCKRRRRPHQDLPFAALQKQRSFSPQQSSAATSSQIITPFYSQPARPSRRPSFFSRLKPSSQPPVRSEPSVLFSSCIEDSVYSPAPYGAQAVSSTTASSNRTSQPSRSKAVPHEASDLPPPY